MSTTFRRRIFRLENPDGRASFRGVANAIELGRQRVCKTVGDPTAAEEAHRAEEARFQALVAREAAGDLGGIETAILGGLRRVRAA